MRVLHVINQLGGAGGAEQGLVREISRFDHSTKQVAVRLYEGDDLVPQLEAGSIEVVALGLRAAHSFWNWPLAVLRVLGLIRRHHPDVIHTSLFIGNLVGQLAAWLARVPVVSTLTLTGNLDMHRRLQPGASSWRAGLLRGLAGFVGRRGHVAYRAITDHAKQSNCATFRIEESRVVVIPRGVPLTEFASAAADRGRFELPEEVPVFVNVGRQTAQKGHFLLLEAFSQILERHPDARLCILGREGEATPQIREMLGRLELAGSVQLLGYRTDAPILLASGDVFVFSSLAEGLGTTVLEAMGAGLPVVAFDIPPVREVTADGRFARLVPMGDTGALASEAQGMLDPEIGGALGKAGQEWVADRYDVAAVARAVETYLRQIAADGSELPDG